MNHRLSTALVSIAACLAVVLPVSTATAATAQDFAGPWSSTDVVDGSHQVMLITPALRIVLIDTSATACSGAPALVTGRGSISGDDLEATLRLRCAGGGTTPNVSATFTANGNGTLTDDLGPGAGGEVGSTWYRPWG